LSAVIDVSGPNCVEDYVNQRLAGLVETLSQTITSELDGLNGQDVIIVMANGWKDSFPTNFFVLAWDDGQQIFVTRDLDRNQVRRPQMSYWEAAMNQLPAGMHEAKDFLTVEKLLMLIAGGKPLYFQHGANDKRFVVIGASLMRNEVGHALQIKWAPAS
jgi:hypothetical protein